MPQSLSQIYVHLIFATKDRRQLIRDEDRDRVIGYFGGILRNMDSALLCGSAQPEHVHLLLRLSRMHSLADTIQRVKGSSSPWYKGECGGPSDFNWQGGYGAFSVSASKVEDVKKYIMNQDEHHKKWDFDEEFRKLLDKHGVDYKAEYL